LSTRKIKILNSEKWKIVENKDRQEQNSLLGRIFFNRSNGIELCRFYVIIACLRSTWHEENAFSYND
jgi:hypothetical protein